MPNEKLRGFLEERNIKYVSIRHSPAYTAQEVAASAHVKGQNMAKTVMVKLDGELAMTVMPAHYCVDIDKLRDVTGKDSVELAHENEFASRFRDCEPGAMPPFGNIYDMDVYVDETLTRDREISFNAGSASEIVRMSYEDYAELVHPKIEDFASRMEHGGCAGR